MPLQVGTLMVVVRAQDFASRTLRRVSGELGAMSKADMIAQRRAQLTLRQMREGERVRQTIMRGRGLSLIKQQMEAEERLRAMRAAGPPRSSLGTFVPNTYHRDIKKLEDSLAKMHTSFDRLDPSMQRFAMRIKDMPQGAAILDAALEGNRRKLMQLGVAAGMTRREVAAFEKAIRMQWLTSLDNIGHALGGVGRTMQLFGAVGTVALGVASNAYAKFNQQVTLAATQTRKAGQSFVQTAANSDKLSRAILGMMRKFPASSEEMAKAAYDIYSSIDVSFGSGLKLLREFNKVAVAGGTDLATATNASITVLENFDSRLANTGKITKTTYGLFNRMFAIVRYGRMNFLQLSQMLAQVVPAATGARQSFDSVSGALAFLTRTLGTKAGPALARLLEVFSNRDIIAGMKKAGAAITDMQGKLLPFPEIIRRMARVAGPNADLNDFFRNISALGRGSGRGREFTIQSRRAFIQLIDGQKEYQKVQKLTVRNNNEFASSFVAMSNTLGVRWQVFMNQLKVLVLYIGEKAIPSFLWIGETISKWIDKWENLSEGTRRSIVRWAAIISIMTLVGGVILAVAGALITLSAALITIAPKFTKIGKGAGNLLFSLRGLAKLGTIAIGISLIKKGGGWAFFGAALTGGMLGKMLRGGARGTIAGATIAIGMQMVLKGDGWKSKIGQILLSAGAGFAFGGPAGAAIGAAAATIPILIELQHNAGSLTKLYEENTRKMREAARLYSTAQNVGPKTGEGFISGRVTEALRKQGLTAGTQSGEEFIRAFLEKLIAGLVRPGGPRDAFDGLARDAQKKFDATKPLDTKKKFSLKDALANAKSYTEILDTVNKQSQAATDKQEELAVKIAMAFSRGNATNARNLLNAYTSMSTQKVTPANILKLITQAVKSGDMQRATQLLQDWVQSLQDGQEELKQYAQEMKDYQKQLADASKQAALDIIGNLRSMYDQMAQENKQAFGELFQGPWLTSETFDLAKEWGIQPRIQDMIKDLNQQNNAFAQWRRSLDAVLKKGLPKGFVDEIRQMGPEQGKAFLDNIMKAKPGQVQALITQWKRRNNQIKSATKMDFSREINAFRTAGLKMGDAIVNGFESAQVSKWFDTWVKNTFPGVINAAVAQAVRQWKTDNPPPKRPNVPTGASAAAASRARGTNNMTTSHTDNSKKYEITIQPPAVHDEGAAGRYAANKEAQRRLAFATRSVLKGLM